MGTLRTSKSVKPSASRAGRSRISGITLHSHATLAPVIAAAFAELGVSVALWERGNWYSVVTVRSVIEFEIEHRKDSERWAYNARCIEEALRKRRALVGEHAGLCDVFVPIGETRRPEAVLVSGPITRTRPTAAELRERWSWLTGGRRVPVSANLAHFISATLEVLTLEGHRFNEYQRLLKCLADVMSARGSAIAHAREADRLRKKLESARFADRMWEAARSMLDEESASRWTTLANANELSLMGLKQPPQNALVGLLRGRGENTDIIDDLIRRDSFQRDCAALAYRVGGVVCGRIGDHGVALLSQPPRRGRPGVRLADIGERAAALARARGLDLHLGLDGSGGSGSLSAHYRAALAAAESALSRGVPTVTAETHAERPARQLYELRRKLGRAGGEPLNHLVPHFEQYMQAAIVQSGYRVEPLRAHLQAGFERVIEGLSATGALADKDLNDLWNAIDRSALDATNVTALLSAYRQIIADVHGALAKPTGARQGLGVRRATDYIHEHLAEPLSLGKVATVAGFAPGHFSKLLKREFGSSFELFTRGIRLERAKQMLGDTSLTVERVAKMCGFGTRNYLHEAFRRAFRTTPFEYRRRILLERAKELLRVSAESIERVAEVSGFESAEQLERAFKARMRTTPLEYRRRHGPRTPRATGTGTDKRTNKS